MVEEVSIASRREHLSLRLQRLCPLVPPMGCSDGDGVWAGGRLGSEANLMLLQGEGRERGPAMEEDCSARPCATDFSIAAIMARDRQERRERRRHRDPREDTLMPLGELIWNYFLVNKYWNNYAVRSSLQNSAKTLNVLFGTKLCQ